MNNQDSGNILFVATILLCVVAMLFVAVAA